MATDGPLRELYPFLHGDRQDAQAMTDALMSSVQRKALDHLQVFDEYFQKNRLAIVEAARTIAEAYRHEGRLLSMGNGGSSCDASHIAVEFVHPVTAGRPALAAIDLTADIATLTAVSNDVGYEHAFVRQLIAHGRRGDCLIGVSTSGNSDNLMRAFEKAREMGIATVGLAGMDGGDMARVGLDHCLVVETESIHRIQECQLATYHILWDLVHTLLADDRGALGSGARP